MSLSALLYVPVWYTRIALDGKPPDSYMFQSIPREPPGEYLHTVEPLYNEHA